MPRNDRAYHAEPAESIYMMCPCGAQIVVTRAMTQRPVDEWIGPDHEMCPLPDGVEGRLAALAEYEGLMD